jgi:hypothetical protein
VTRRHRVDNWRDSHRAHVQRLRAIQAYMSPGWCGTADGFARVSHAVWLAQNSRCAHSNGGPCHWSDRSVDDTWRDVARCATSVASHPSNRYPARRGLPHLYDLDTFPGDVITAGTAPCSSPSRWAEQAGP